MPTYNPTAAWNLKTYGAEVPRFGKGAIDLFVNDTTRLVTDNDIRNNRIDGVRGDGVHIRGGNVCSTYSLGERDGQPQWRPGQDHPLLLGDLPGRMIIRTRRFRIARMVRHTDPVAGS